MTEALFVTSPLRHEFVPESERLYSPSLFITSDFAMQLWREWSCEEFTGGAHDYQLTVEEGQAMIQCGVCRHDPLTDYDLNELISFGPVPINLAVREIHYPGGPWGSDEYDVEVEVTAR